MECDCRDCQTLSQTSPVFPEGAYGHVKVETSCPNPRCTHRVVLCYLKTPDGQTQGV